MSYPRLVAQHSSGSDVLVAPEQAAPSKPLHGRHTIGAAAPGSPTAAVRQHEHGHACGPEAATCSHAAAAAMRMDKHLRQPPPCMPPSTSEDAPCSNTVVQSAGAQLPCNVSAHGHGSQLRHGGSAMHQNSGPSTQQAWSRDEQQPLHSNCTEAAAAAAAAAARNVGSPQPAQQSPKQLPGSCQQVGEHPDSQHKSESSNQQDPTRPHGSHGSNSNSNQSTNDRLGGRGAQASGSTHQGVAARKVMGSCSGGAGGSNGEGSGSGSDGDASGGSASPFSGSLIPGGCKAAAAGMASGNMDLSSGNATNTAEKQQQQPGAGEVPAGAGTRCADSGVTAVLTENQGPSALHAARHNRQHGHGLHGHHSHGKSHEQQSSHPQGLPSHASPLPNDNNLQRGAHAPHGTKRMHAQHSSQQQYRMVQQPQRHAHGRMGSSELHAPQPGGLATTTQIVASSDAGAQHLHLPHHHQQNWPLHGMSGGALMPARQEGAAGEGLPSDTGSGQDDAPDALPGCGPCDLDDCKSNGSSQARATKRQRLVWTPELHNRFMTAVHQLGVNNAVPKTIMQLMNVEGMTRENVASHLQKYRLYLKRLAGITGNDPIPTHVLAHVQDQAVRQHSVKQMVAQQQAAVLQAQVQQHQQQRAAAVQLPAPGLAAQAQFELQMRGFNFGMPPGASMHAAMFAPTSLQGQPGCSIPGTAQSCVGGASTSNGNTAGMPAGLPGATAAAGVGFRPPHFNHLNHPLLQQQQQQAFMMQQALQLQHMASMGGFGGGFGGQQQQGPPGVPAGAMAAQAAAMQQQAAAMAAQVQQQMQAAQQGMTGMAPSGSGGLPTMPTAMHPHYAMLALQQQQQQAQGMFPGFGFGGQPVQQQAAMLQQQAAAAAGQAPLVPGISLSQQPSLGLQHSGSRGPLEQQQGQQQQGLMAEAFRQQQGQQQQQQIQAAQVQAYLQMQQVNGMQLQHMYAM